MVFTQPRLGVGVYKEASLQVPSISGSRGTTGGEEGERTGMAYHILLGTKQQLKCEATMG